jgi:hypothetical protein
MTDDPRQQPVGHLVTQLSEQVSTLVRDELALARTEMVEKGKRAGAGAGLLGTAGVLALYGVGTLLVAAVAALALVWSAWLAALAVAVAVFAVAAVLALTGKKQVSEAVPTAPTMAVTSTKADVQAVKAAVKEGRRA